MSRLLDKIDVCQVLSIFTKANQFLPRSGASPKKQATFQPCSLLRFAFSFGCAQTSGI